MDNNQDNEMEKTKIKEIKERAGKRNYPLRNLDDSIRIAEVVEEMKGKATVEDISDGVKTKGGALLSRIASAKRWGLIEGQGMINITSLAMDILHPEKDDDDTDAKLRAYFNVPIFKTIYETYGWELPRKELLVNVLIRQGVQKKDATTLANLIYLYRTIFCEQVLELGGVDNVEDDNVVSSGTSKVFHSVGEFKKAARGGDRLTVNNFNIILCLGSLREGIKNFDKENIEGILKTLRDLVPSEHPLINGQIEVLKSDVSILDTESLNKVMPQRVNALIQSLMHTLGAEI